jgi:hypothetical protein
MGNKISIATSNVFQDDLKKVNELVNSMLNADNTFINPNYNFLSQDVCKQHTLVLESELQKHLKVSLNELGAGMFLIPNNDHSESKKKICKKISSHYMKILYLLTLIKYVYDLEHHGDYSIAGIIFRNLQVEDDILSIKYCAMSQKDFSKASNSALTQTDKRVNFKQLEGLSFFVEYVLDKEESQSFMSAWKAVIERKGKTVVKKRLCDLLNRKTIDRTLTASLEDAYKAKYNDKLGLTGGSPDMLVAVAPDNPVFLKEYCYDAKQIVVRLGTKNSQEVETAFKTMKANYDKNVACIEKILYSLVSVKGKQYELKDVVKQDLDTIATKLKYTISMFYIQSILDYQNLLDIAKSNHSIQLNEQS